MIKGIFHFFNRERAYGVLFLVLVAFYALSPLVLERPSPQSGPSKAVEEFRASEEQWQQKVKESGSIQQFLRLQPRIAMIFAFISLFIFASIGLGLIIDIFFIFVPSFRKKLSLHGPPHEFGQWEISMLFKVVVLWTGTSLALGLFIGLIRRFIWPDISLNFYIILHTTLIDFLTLFFILYVIGHHGGRFRDVGLWVPKGKFFREVGIGVAGYLAVLPFFFLILLTLVVISQMIAYEPAPHPLVDVFLEEDTRAPALVMYSIFLASIIGPFIEEVFFRGFCYPILKAKWGVGWGMVLSSALFAFIHQNQFAFLPIFVLGMGLSYLYEKRGSLVAPITLHLTHNTSFLIYFFLAKNMIQQGVG